MTPRETRQLRATFDALAGASDHPTTEQVFRRVRRLLPRVSLGTVYRNLEKLRAQGRARVVHIAGGPARYDARIGEHDHFLCEACSAVIDLEPLRGRADTSRLRRDGFVVHAQSVALYGLCRGCAMSPAPPRRRTSAVSTSRRGIHR